MPSKKRKLLVTTSTFRRWKGDVTPPFVYDLSKRLARDFDIWVLAPHSGGAARSEECEGMHIVRYRYGPDRYESLGERAILPHLRKNPLSWLQVPFFLVAQLRAVRKIAKEQGIHCIHAHWILPQGIIAVLYKRLFDKDVRIVVTSHGGDIFGLRSRPLTLLKKWVLNHIDHLTVVSSAIRDEVASLGIRTDLPIDVVPMGVDLSLFSPEHRDEGIRRTYAMTGPFLLFVGRLSEKKGVEYLIEAMPSILRDFPETKLLIIGGGERKGALKALCEQRGVQGSVIFVGTIAHNDLPAYYATADIFIGPSVIAKGGDREGVPVTYMEAAASGCTLLGTDLEGNRDIIEDGRTGLMIRQRDPRHIADTVRYVLSNGNDMNEMSDRARRAVMHTFDWDDIAHRYGTILQP